jgi:4'-phosphopantetheinyl transferase
MSAAPPVEVDLHVWTLDVDADERARLARFLSEDEAARANRLVFEHDRARFVVARGRMREILGSATGRAPATLRFSYAKHGKPSLGGSAPRFNLSHSQAIAALALTKAHEIGVDVEHVRPLKEDIAGRFFSKRENALLRALPQSEQLGGFFRCWTRKEAIVKAIGEGLSHPLDSFDVSLRADEPAAVERFEGETAAAWQLAHFEPAQAYVGAIACRTGGPALKIRLAQPTPQPT